MAAEIAVMLGLAAVQGIMGGAAQSAQNAHAKKVAEAQNKYAKAQYNFQNRQNQDLYNYQVASQKIQKGNNKLQVDLQNQIARDQFKYQRQQRIAENRAQAEQYKKSEQQFGTQLEFNKKAADLAKGKEDNFLNEVAVGKAFARQDIFNDLAIARDKAAFEIGGERLALEGQAQDFRNEQIRLNTGIRNLRDSSALQQRGLQNKKGALRDETRRNIEQERANFNFKRDSINRQLSSLRGETGDIKSKFERDKKALSIKFQGDRQELRIQDQLALQARNDQNRDLNNNLAKLGIQESALDNKLASLDLDKKDVGFEIASLQNQRQGINLRERDAAENLKIQKLSLDQDRLSQSGTVQEQLRENRVAQDRVNLQMSEDFASVEQQQEMNSIAYGQDRAQNAFQQQANIIARIQGQGAAQASGKRGRSADRNFMSVMAESGRQQAALADTMTRRTDAYETEQAGFERRKSFIQESRRQQISDLKGKRSFIKDQGKIASRKLDLKDRQLSRQQRTNAAQADLDRSGVNNTINRTKLKFDRIENSKKDVALNKASLNIDKKGIKQDLRSNDLRYQSLKKLSDGKLSRLKESFTNDKDTLRADRASDLRNTKEKAQALRAEKRFERSAMGRRQKALRSAMNFSLANITNEQKQISQNIRNQTRVKNDTIRANKAAFNIAKKEFGLDVGKIKNTLKHQQASSRLKLKMENQKFKSAKKSVALNKQQIDMDKFEADMRADAQRMSKPVKAPPIPRPYKIPYTIYQAPRPPMKGPKPVKNVAYTPNPFLTGAQQFVSSIDAGALGSAMASKPGAGTPTNNSSGD